MPSWRTGAWAREQILKDFANLHELTQSGRLGDESGYPQGRKLCLVAAGPGGTPNADRNSAEMVGIPDLAQDVLAGILREVQIHQNHVVLDHAEPLGLVF